LLQFLPLNLIAGLLGFQWFGFDVKAEVWCSEQWCSMRAPPLGLSVGLTGLWLLYEGLWMVVGVMFVVCVWFEWLFEQWLGLVVLLLGMSLQPEAPFRVSFWVTFRWCFLELTNGRRQC
jgi:hypothetical protein